MSVVRCVLFVVVANVGVIAGVVCCCCVMLLWLLLLSCNAVVC